MTGRDSHERGTTTEAIVISEFKKIGLSVSIPFGRPRYDAVVDDGDRLYRVQIKTGRYVEEEGSVKFNCRSTHINSEGYTSKSYKGDIDAFVVYSLHTDETYWIEEEDAGEREMTLRVEEPDFDHPRINYETEFRLAEAFGK